MLKLKFDQDRLIKDTDKKDTGGMRKEWGTGEKKCRNLLDKECEQGLFKLEQVRNVMIIGINDAETRLNLYFDLLVCDWFRVLV